MLIDGDVVADFGAFSNHAETVIEKEALPNLSAGMNVDAGQEPGEMVDQSGKEEKLPFP